MAGLDKELDVSIHERRSHCDGGSVREDKVGVLAETLDDAEDVVPATTVETGRVVTELIDDLVHLECSHDGLDEDSASDGASWHANVILSKVEGVVPKSGLEVALHLRQVEVRASSALDQLVGVVEEVKTKVEQTGRDGLTVDSEMLLLEVPATSTSNKSGESTVGTELVLLLALLEINLPTNSIVKINLAVDHVVPGRCTRVYSVLVIYTPISWKRSEATHLRNQPYMSRHQS